MRMDRQTDMTKLTVGFRNSTNTPETPSNALTSMLYNYPWTGLDRPLGLQGVKALRISRQSAPEGGQVVSHTHRPPLSLQDIPGTGRPQATVQPEGLNQ